MIGLYRPGPTGGQPYFVRDNIMAARGMLGPDSLLYGTYLRDLA